AADEAGHSVPEECRRRIAAVATDSLPAAIGALAEIVTTQAETIFPVLHPSSREGGANPALLGIVRDALAAVLPKLGAESVEALSSVGGMIAEQLAERIKSADETNDQKTHPEWRSETRRLARIRETIGLHAKKGKSHG